jgi:hypothetical protein
MRPEGNLDLGGLPGSPGASGRALSPRERRSSIAGDLLRKAREGEKEIGSEGIEGGRWSSAKGRQELVRFLSIGSVSSSLSLLAIMFVSVFIDMANVGYDREGNKAQVLSGVGNDGSTVRWNTSLQQTLPWRASFLFLGSKQKANDIHTYLHIYIYTFVHLHICTFTHLCMYT